ncbi:MAG: trypsin-like peptidase domain-containing protein [Planctomycetota bacterium]|nr:trypsin-like peptidase domain-containing protein [Planctomycetota bacterium]
MSLRVRCPKCKQVFEFDQPAAACVIECTYCHQRMKWAPKIPKASPAAPAPEPAIPVEPSASPEPAIPVADVVASEPWPPPEDLAPVKLVKPARPPMPVQRTNPALIIGIVAVGVVVVGMAATIAYMAMSGSSSTQTPAPTPTPGPTEIAKTPAPTPGPTPTPGPSPTPGPVTPTPPAPTPPTPAPPPVTGPIESPVDLDAQTIYAKASPSVARIEVMRPDYSHMAQGSGFVVSSDGFVVTNHHVMRAGRKGLVLLGEGKAYPVAVVLVSDQKKDLAVIKINATGLPYFALFPKDKKPAVGSKAFAIGSPLGQTNTLSEGLVSGLRDEPNRTVVQTTAEIAGGSSGGPLLDARCRVIGVNTYSLADRRGDEIVATLKFAVAHTEVHEMLARAKAALAKMTTGSGGKPLDATSSADLAQAYAHVSKSQWLDAAVGAKTLRTRNPENAEVLLLSAFLALKMNQTDEAVETYKKVVELDPNEFEGHLGLGLVYNQKKMWKEAEEVLSHAAKLRSEDASLQHALGEALLELGRKDEALTALKESTRLDPEDADAWMVLGRAYLAQKLLAPAADAFRTVIRHDPHNPLAHAYLAMVEYQNGRMNDAKEAAGVALRLQPGCPMGLYVMGLVFVNAKDWDNARKALGALEGADPKLFKELADAIKEKGGDPTPLKGDIPKKDDGKKEGGKKDDGKKETPKPPAPDPKKPK